MAFRCESGGHYLFGVLRAFFATLSTKSGFFMDRRQKFRVLSMKRTLFVDKRDSVGLRKDLLFLDTTDGVTVLTFVASQIGTVPEEGEAVSIIAVRSG